jgi:RecA-family ATPase
MMTTLASDRTDTRLQPDCDEAERFLSALDPNADRFTFQTFDDNKERKDEALARILHGTLARRWDELVELNARGCGIFVTVNVTDLKGRSISNILGIRAVFADLDGAPLDPVLADGMPRPHIITETSPGRWHCYWHVIDGMPLKEFTPLQEAIAVRFDGDPKPKDLPRVMRLPGFVHRKAEPFLSRVVQVNDIEAYDWAELAKLFPPPSKSEVPRSATQAGAGGNSWRDLNGAALRSLDAWVPRLFPAARKGELTWRVTSRALGRDLEEDLSFHPTEGIRDFGEEKSYTPIDLIAEWLPTDPKGAVRWLAQALGDDPRRYLYERADENAGRTNGSGGQAPKEPPPPLPLVNMSNWDNEPVPAQEWTVLNRVPRRQCALFSGEGAAGKSTIWLHAAAAHVLGREWLGSLPEIGPAIFVDAEDDVGVMHRRLAAIVNYYGATFSDLIKGGLNLISLFGRDAVLALANRNGKVAPTPLYMQILQVAGDIKPVSIGLASSANMFAGNEIDRSQVQQFISLLNRLAIVSNGSVTLISHPSLTGISTDTGLSGNTQWHNAVRARFYLKGIKPESDDQPESDLRELVFKKNQYGPVSESIVLRYRNGLFLPVAGVSTLDRAAQEMRADKIFLALLRRFTAENRIVTDKPGRAYAPALFAREDEAKEVRLTNKALEAAMRRLFKTNRIWNAPRDGKPSRADATRLALRD